MKRNLHGEDGFSVLQSLHEPGAEALPVADPIDLVENRPFHVAALHEVAVQAVRHESDLDGCSSSRERLTNDLSSVDDRERVATFEQMASPGNDSVSEGKISVPTHKYKFLSTRSKLRKVSMRPARMSSARDVMSMCVTLRSIG